MTTCLICDDHSLVREALAGSFRRAVPAAEVILAKDYTQAWQLANVQPDLCVCDLVMPGASPLEGITTLQQIAPNMSIIVLTALEDDSLMLDLLAAGVAAFVNKTESGEVLASVIHLVLAGARYLPTRLLGLIAVNANSGASKPSSVCPVNLTTKVTRQQSKVLELLARGQTNKEMARELDVAPSTVKFHMDLLLRRFEARNRTEVLTRAMAIGLIADS
jgi:two-component system, NarL family, nitrate/nitrite response regulator NarL